MLQPPTPAREPTTRIHAPSQPLMQPPLSRNLTPATPRRARRIFRVWSLTESPRFAGHPAYFGSANLFSCQPFRPSTKVRLRFDEFTVNARYWCSEVEIPVILLKSQQKRWIHRRDAEFAEFAERGSLLCIPKKCSDLHKTEKFHKRRKPELATVQRKSSD